MQDLSKKIRFLKLRKKIWRSRPYRFYIKCYDFFIKTILRFNKRHVKIIFINGMRRSGNHYLMKTLMNSASSSVIYYNNQKRISDLDIKNGLQVKFRTSKKILLIIGYEDLLIEDFNQSCNYILNRRFNNIESIRLIIIRDIRNMMASRLNHAHMSKELREKSNNVNKTRNLWANHHHCGKDVNFGTVRYGHLIFDLNKINLHPFFISGLIESRKILNRYGGGSSFENNNFSSRYTKFLGNKIYESLIIDFKELDESTHGEW